MFFTILGTKSNVQAKVDRSKSYATTIMSKNSDRRFKHTKNLYILGLDDKQTAATTGQEKTMMRRSHYKEFQRLPQRQSLYT